VQRPTGTIERSVRDGLSRVVSQWVGTNDTPASGEWEPGNNTSSANMIQTVGYVYDGVYMSPAQLEQSFAALSGVPISEIGAQEHTRTQGARLERMRAAGLDPDYGRRLPAAFGRLGLTDTGTEGRVWVMEGGSPAARWFRLSMEQLRGSLTGLNGLSDAEVDRMLQLFDDPDWAAMTPIIMAAWGRRPIAEG